ncbi:MAG: hypothetical protein HW387_1031 [Parachlamydiales bacterium]|nr:hypothetical protein [Parachlamydiales bacterium]
MIRPNKQLLAILAAVLLFIVFFPQIASTAGGKRFFLESIQSKTHTTVTADKLTLSWFGPQQFSNLTFHSEELTGSIDELRVSVPLWSMLSLFELKKMHRIHGDASIVNGSFHLTSAQFPSVQLDAMQGSVRLHQGSADIAFDGKSLQDSGPGSFSLQGQIKSLSDAFKEFSLRGELIDFPTLAIGRILSARYSFDENLLIKILGNTINLQGSASKSENNGLIDLTFNAPNLDLTVHGNLENDDLTIRQPVIATFRLTPELSVWILKDINPLFITGIEAKSPLHLRIEPSRFRCPLSSFHLQHLQIGQGTLEMGRIHCQNTGALSSLIGLLKERSSSGSMIDVWFTPLQFSFINGELKTGRMDALINESIRICTWGNINLIDDQMDMILGLTAETLKNSFGIKNLPAEYVLKIPLTGSTRNPSLATGSATAKIAALLAAQKTTHHWLSGSILGIFSQTEGNVPPPNRPFPWEQ